MINNFNVIKAMVAELGFAHEHNGLSEEHAGCFVIYRHHTEEEFYPTFFIFRKDDADLCPTSLDEPVTLSYGNFADQSNIDVDFPNIVSLIDAWNAPDSEYVSDLKEIMKAEYDKIKDDHCVQKQLKQYAMVDIDVMSVVRIERATERPDVSCDGYPRLIPLCDEDLESIAEQVRDIMKGNV